MQGTAQRFALPALGGLVTPSDADNAEACKMLVEAAESPASGARFVRWRVLEITPFISILCQINQPIYFCFDTIYQLV